MGPLLHNRVRPVPTGLLTSLDYGLSMAYHGSGVFFARAKHFTLPDRREARRRGDGCRLQG